MRIAMKATAVAPLLSRCVLCLNIFGLILCDVCARVVNIFLMVVCCLGKKEGCFRSECV